MVFFAFPAEESVGIAEIAVNIALEVSKRHDLSRFLFALLIKSTLPKGESDICSKYHSKPLKNHANSY